MTHRKIDQYEILREIGRGGMGFVYLCRDRELDRIVALKVMRRDRIKNIRSNDRQRFIREAITTARLQHPGIPPVFCVKRTEDDELYYAMKLIDGQPLDDILRKIQEEDEATVQKFNTHRLVEILKDVCQTLIYVHAKGFIHRDLKPSNIFVGDYGEVYLIDWGLTKKFGVDRTGTGSQDWEDSTVLEEISDESTLNLLEEIGGANSLDAPDENEELTLKGDLLGTPAYMPPEQTIRHAELSPSADIYALGVILYRMLTMKLPLVAKDLKSLVLAKRGGHLTHPDEASPERDIPPELAAISMQAMATRPEDRFESVLEFSRSLEFWLEGRSQFRKVELPYFTMENFQVLPPDSSHQWLFNDQVIKTRVPQKSTTKSSSNLFFKKPFHGDLRLSVNLRVLPVSDEGGVLGSFGIVFKSSEPDTTGMVDQYTLHLAQNNNTRISLTRNGTELASNENHLFEPNKKYHVVVETDRGEIRVTVNARVVLTCLDRSPLSGAWLGFLHSMQPVIYSRMIIMNRGLPLKTSVMDIPEALMAEGCYPSAARHFLDIYRNHRFRYVGSWSAYRAGIAVYRETHLRSEALRIWSQLRETRHRGLEHLGLARIELINKRPLEAARYIEKILEERQPSILLRSIADFTQEHTQKLLRDFDGERGWKVVDRWVRLTLQLDEILERHDPLSLSLLWRWLFQTVTKHPHDLSEVIAFVRQIYGGEKGSFGDLITDEVQLKKIVQRTLGMKNHTFLLEKFMRLIVWHEDPIEDLETLGRFYLNSGHERIALQIFQQLIKICINAQKVVPAAPVAYVACYLWMHGEPTEARRYFKVMMRACKSWGPSDALFFLGLDDYRKGRRLNAVGRWKSIQAQSKNNNPLRYGIASALLGETGNDPVGAGIPDRHDYRLLFFFFVGLRHYFDWKQSESSVSRSKALQLFTQMGHLMKPSFDIYASTEAFVRVPLEELGAQLAERDKPEILGDDEKDWLRQLILTIRNETLPKA